MRPIMPGEKTLSAAEIAHAYFEKTGKDLHPTNVGNAAKKLDLDFVEVEEDIELPNGVTKSVARKCYSKLDVEQIFLELDELVARRK